MARLCTKLMIIRHAERPDKATNVIGVSQAGAADNNELTVKGWQRAGALVRLFNPSQPTWLRPGLAVPAAIFAAPATDDNPSKRPMRTVEALAADLNLDVQTRFALHQEKALVAAALDDATAVLICWHHERIPKITAELGVAIDPWPDAIFDRVLVFDRAGDAWKLTMTPQHALPGDS